MIYSDPAFFFDTTLLPWDDWCTAGGASSKYAYSNVIFHVMLRASLTFEHATHHSCRYNFPYLLTHKSWVQFQCTVSRGIQRLSSMRSSSCPHLLASSLIIASRVFSKFACFWRYCNVCIQYPGTVPKYSLRPKSNGGSSFARAKPNLYQQNKADVLVFCSIIAPSGSYLLKLK